MCYNIIMSNRKITYTKQYKHLMVLMNNAGIKERQERLDIASVLLRRPVDTFTSFTAEEVDILISYFTSWKAIQEQRFTNGVMGIESEMVCNLFEDTTKLNLSDDGVLSTSTSRRKFMDFYQISEKDYQSTDDFGSMLADITSAASRDIKVKQLTVNHGRWKKWQLVSPPTTSIGLATGIGGVPRGKIMHVWGQKHGGKSYLALSMIAKAQEDGMFCILFDTEAAATGDLAEQLGVDVSNLAVLTPDNIEDLGNMLKIAVQKKNLFIVIDSIAATESGAELSRDYNKASKVGANSQTWKSILNTSRAALQDNGSTMVLINQVRAKMNTMNPYEYPFKAYGGAAIHHNVDISFRVEAITEKNKGLKDKGYKISRLYFDKNRFAEMTTVDLIFRPGTPYDQAIDLARVVDTEVTAGANVTYGVLADNVFQADKFFNESNGNIVSKKNRYVLRVDPWMMAAIMSDEPDFDEVDIKPAEDFDPYGEVPGVDIENSTYFNIPGMYEANATKWLREHPNVMRVISERLLDSLNKRQEVVEDVAGIVRKHEINEDEIIDETVEFRDEDFDGDPASLEDINVNEED